jgi:hypothetical protein
MNHRRASAVKPFPVSAKETGAMPARNSTAAFFVANTQGSGFLEKVYENALAV